MNKQANWKNLFRKKKNNELSQFIDTDVLPIAREMASVLTSLQKHKGEFGDLFQTVKDVYYGVQTLRQQLNQKTASSGIQNNQVAMLAGRLEELLGNLSGAVQQMMQMTNDNVALKNIYGLNMKIKNVLDYLKNYAQMKEEEVKQQQMIQQQQQPSSMQQQQPEPNNALASVPQIFHKHLKRLPGYESAGILVDVQGIRGELDAWLSNYGAQAKDETGDYKGRYIQLATFSQLMQGQQPERPEMKLRSRKGDPSEERRVTPDNEPDISYKKTPTQSVASISEGRKNHLKNRLGY